MGSKSKRRKPWLTFVTAAVIRQTNKKSNYGWESRPQWLSVTFKVNHG